MDTNLLSFSNYFDIKKKELEKEFAHFIQFKSISAQPEYLEECKQCAQWIQGKLEQMGFSTSLWGDNFPPTVFGCLQGDPSAPTLLLYNHYDVQPVDPLDLWDSDPFLATQKGNKIVARGASDNKGQAFYILTALSYFHEKENRFPCTIKILMEGEEESGSPHLGKLLQKHRKELQADYAMIVDLGMRSPQKPAITLGTRGLVGMTIEVTGTHEDLHSGIHGGLAYNPLHALVEILAKIRDETGRIAIPGFYDDITASSEELLKQLSWSFSCKEYEEAFGQTPTGGEKELHPLNRVWLNPTVEINGIVGGYGGSGSKTIIPAKAIAKITCRLVPGQDPSRIGSLLKSFFESNSPKGVHTKVTLHPGSGKATRTDPSSLCIKTLSRALEEVFLTKPEFILEGGTIGPVPEIQEATGAEIVLWGIGLPTDKIHSPNEEFDWIRMKQGFLVLCRTIELLRKH